MGATRRGGPGHRGRARGRALRAWRPGVEACETRALLTTFAPGDVVAGGVGRLFWHRPDGTVVATIDVGTPKVENTGLAFTRAGELLSTNFQDDTITRLDDSGRVLGKFGAGSIPTLSHPESLALDREGNVYVGLADGHGSILKLDPSGNLLATFHAQTENRGTDWLELAPDQHTLYYTSEGSKVFRFDTATNTQLPDFATGLPGDDAFALRLLADGRLLVADSDSVLLLSATGQTLREYSAPPGTGHPADPQLFALNLDPDGQTFWTADLQTGHVIRFNIETGALVTDFYEPTGVSGLVVKGEIVQAVTAADLSVAAVDPPAVTTVGYPFDLTFTVHNDGPDASLAPVLTADLPDGLAYLDADPAGTVSGGTLDVPLGPLAAGAARTVTLHLRADQVGPYSLDVRVSGPTPDPSPGDNSTSVSWEAVPVALPSPPPVATPGPAPRIVALGRFGVHHRPTILQLVFDVPLVAARATDPSQYTITLLRRGRPVGASVAVRTVTYDTTTGTVSLIPVRRLDFHKSYRLVVNGQSPNGLVGTDGVFLDGRGDGRPGTDFVAAVHGVGRLPLPSGPLPAVAGGRASTRRHPMRPVM